MTFRRVLPMLLAVTGIALSIGCVIVPGLKSAGHYWDDQHKRIDDGMVQRLKPGVTTAEDIRRDLGKPSHELMNGSVLVYSWSRPTQTFLTFRAITLCSTGGQASNEMFSSPSPTIRHLLLRFDANGVVQQMRVRTGGYVNQDATGIDDAVKFATD